MLSRKECLDILGLDETSAPRDIENRYTILVKRYRGEDSEQAHEILDQAALAYNILTGRYIEPEPVNPRLEKVVFGKSLKQWQNVWHYGKVPLLVGLLIVALVTTIIVSMVTNEKADYTIIVMGHFRSNDDSVDRLTEYLADSEGAYQNPMIHVVPIYFEPMPAESDITSETTVPTEPPFKLDGQTQYAYTMKLVTLMHSDAIDFYMTTENAFLNYAAQGPFEDISPLYERLQDLPDDILDQIIPVYASLRTGYDLDEDAGEIIADDSEQIMMGLDVTGLDIFEAMGFSEGDAQILSVGIKAKDLQQTFDFLESWIRDYEEMSQRAAKLAD